MSEPVPAPATNSVQSIPEPKRNRWRNPIGWVLTAVYLGLAAWYAYINNVADLEPDKLADFVGGIFAPLAFLWLVLGFFQQGDELRVSSDALLIQGQELRNSVEQQRQLVEATREAIAFERERAEEDRKEQKRRAQPQLFLEVRQESFEFNVTTSQIALINKGATCTAISLELDGQSWNTPIFEKGDVHTFVLHTPTGAPTGVFNYTASFLDGLGEYGEQVLTLIAYKDDQARTLLRPPA